MDEQMDVQRTTAGQMDGRTNTTDYTDTYVTYTDNKTEERKCTLWPNIKMQALW